MAQFTKWRHKRATCAKSDLQRGVSAKQGQEHFGQSAPVLLSGYFTTHLVTPSTNIPKYSCSAVCQAIKLQAIEYAVQEGSAQRVYHVGDYFAAYCLKLCCGAGPVPSRPLHRPSILRKRSQLRIILFCKM